MQSVETAKDKFIFFVDVRNDNVIYRIEAGGVELVLHVPDARPYPPAHASVRPVRDCVCHTVEDDFDIQWLSRAFETVLTAKGSVPVPGFDLRVSASKHSMANPVELNSLYRCHGISVSPTSWFNKDSCRDVGIGDLILLIRASDADHENTVSLDTLGISSVVAQLVQRHLYRFHVPLTSSHVLRTRKFFTKAAWNPVIKIRRQAFIQDVRKKLIKHIRLGIMTRGLLVHFVDTLPGMFRTNADLNLFTRIGEELENHHLLSRVDEEKNRFLIPAVFSTNIPLTSLQ